MSKNEPLAIGKVEWLCIEGENTDDAFFSANGPCGDRHESHLRRLSGHDGTYIRTSSLKQGDEVFNFRSWTGLSLEEITEIESGLGYDIPMGCLLENIVISGVQSFSKLAPTSRLVFPKRDSWIGDQAILAVWEENGPCKTVGQRLAEHHNLPELKASFVKAALNKRGVMGFVFSPGEIRVGDEVLIYPPVNQ